MAFIELNAHNACIKARNKRKLRNDQNGRTEWLVFTLLRCVCCVRCVGWRPSWLALISDDGRQLTVVSAWSASDRRPSSIQRSAFGSLARIYDDVTVTSQSCWCCADDWV